MRNPYNTNSNRVNYAAYIALAAVAINLFFAYAASSLTAPYGGVRSSVSLAIFIAIAVVSAIGLIAVLIAFKTMAKLSGKSYPDFRIGIGIVGNGVAFLTSLAILLFAFTPIISYFSNTKDVDLTATFENRLAGNWEFSSDSFYLRAEFTPGRHVHIKSMAKDLPLYDYTGTWSIIILKGESDPTLRILVDHLFTGSTPPVGTPADFKFQGVTENGLTISNNQDVYLLLPQGGQQTQPAPTTKP